MMLRLETLLKCGFLGLMLTTTLPVHACTIFMANDGENVWIGNNEDELQHVKYRMWYYPSRKNHFGYSIWTELPLRKLLHGVSYLNPQGGLNEFGLFMDYTLIDQIPIDKDDQKKNRRKQVVTDVLKTCKTVDEALTYINRYNLVKLTKAQLFIGDASGNYATVTGGFVVRKTDKSFALTNYCIKDGHKEACYRRDITTRYLNSTSTFELDGMKTILEKSSQKLPNNLISNYSMAVNLKTRTIYLYYKNDFTTVSVLSLAEELKRSKHHKDIVDYFPESITPLIEQEFKSNGITAAVAKYTELRKRAAGRYNFTNDDAVNIAISWIENGQTMGGIKLLECLKEFDKQKANIYSWLGVAYRKDNNTDESNKNFKKALDEDPHNYVATLFGKQHNQQVTFQLPDFEAAEQVFLMGNFTGWTKHPIKMIKVNDFWTCKVSLPKGEVTYKFIVNNQYLADSKNFMHVGTGPDVYSVLYVW